MSKESDYFEIISHEIRRKILKLIYERIEVSYTEILKYLGISDGLLNFHLRRMGDLIEKTINGTYILTPKGKRIYELIKNLELEDEEEDKLDMEIIARRVFAFLIDGVIFIMFSGLIFDLTTWNSLIEILYHLSETFNPHPWIFHPEHIYQIGNVIYRVAGVYAHMFFAIYIFITLMEAYKGQTPGKYLMKIRVLKKGGLKLGVVESGIRNAGKIFLLPLDLIVGIIFFRRKGFIRFFDYYTDCVTEKVI